MSEQKPKGMAIAKVKATEAAKAGAKVSDCPYRRGGAALGMAETVLRIATNGLVRWPLKRRSRR